MTSTTSYLKISLNKMFSKTLLIFLIVNFLSDCSYGQKDIKFFRKDYTYIEASESFYKIHTLHKSWADAKRVCALEGASLFYPENDNEAHAVLSFWNSTQPFMWVYVGISDLLVKGVFETIDGHPVLDVYNNWGAGEPNDAGGVEDCVILRRDGTMNDDGCLKKNPFICKKSLISLEWNEKCSIPNLGTPLDDTGYVSWGHNQPDGEDREQCGSMFYDGLLNDIICNTICFFICEHEVDILASQFDDRFSNPV